MMNKFVSFVSLVSTFLGYSVYLTSPKNAAALIPSARNYRYSTGLKLRELNANDEKNNLKYADTDKETFNTSPRRVFLESSLASTFWAFSHPSIALASNEETSLVTLRSEIEQAKAQLGPVAGLIQDEKWDSIRTILGTPPLSACWSKTGQSKALLQRYAEAIGNDLPDGDELAALEGKEDAISHLRYLDMAVYNNVFNPITTEGTAGATKELVRSYYEDPKLEYQASLKALNELIQLSR